MIYLQQDKNIPTTVQYFTQALIHSNLFDAYTNRNGKLTDLTLNEMAARHHKKPFICSIIDGIYVCIRFYMYIYVSVCFHKFLYVIVCLYTFLYVFVCFYMLLYVSVCFRILSYVLYFITMLQFKIKY